MTANGPVHVWTPAKYNAETAGIVVYVHGFYTQVDRAWRDHRLAQQFAESKLNAMFIACAAPRGPKDSVKWPSIEALLAAVAEQVPAGLPAGPVVAVGHSGAHRTMSQWLFEDRLDTIVFYDAFHGDMPQLQEWLERDPERRLINVAALTKPWAEELHAALPDTVVFDRFPSPRAGKLKGARDGRVVYVRSQHDHMGLVTNGVALPMLLRAVRLPLVANASRTAPIRRR